LDASFDLSPDLEALVATAQMIGAFRLHRQGRK
jgi:hypothetical protein